MTAAMKVRSGKQVSKLASRAHVFRVERAVELRFMSNQLCYCGLEAGPDSYIALKRRWGTACNSDTRHDKYMFT